MGVPTSEVGYTIATTRRETTKVHKNMWWHWRKKKTFFRSSSTDSSYLNFCFPTRGVISGLKNISFLQGSSSCILTRYPIHFHLLSFITLTTSYSWRINQLDVTCYFYFSSYILNIFRALIHSSSGICDYAVELPHWSFRSLFAVCWRLGAVRLA